MRFSYINNQWLETVSEEELEKAEKELDLYMEKLDNEDKYFTDEYSRVSSLHIDVVNAIVSRFPVNLPHREHGWYLPNDD